MENNQKQKIVLWINKEVSNIENYLILSETFQPNLKNYEIIPLTSVSSAFNEINKNYDKFKFRLFYVIISGELAKEFFTLYVIKSIELHILAATIIFCNKENKKYHEKEPYFLDDYLNPGKITDNPYDVINYIKKVECEEYVNINNIILNEEKENFDYEFASEFCYVNDFCTIAFPIFISKHINSSSIDDEEFKKMQINFMKEFPKLKHLLKPSEEKNINVPYHILAKYYLNIYTQESNFFQKMNFSLKNKKFDKYRLYIYLLYNCLNKGIFKSFSSENLYRGGTLGKKEFENLIIDFVKMKNKKSKINTVLYYSRKFLSFTKKFEVAKNYLLNSLHSGFEGVVYVLFIVEGVKNEEFFVSNIDVNAMKLSDFENEEEVLFLPLSCFEIVDIKTNEDFQGYQIKEIHLKYLNNYKNKINEEIDNLKENTDNKDFQNFITNSLCSKYAKELTRYLGQELNLKFIKEFERKLDIKLNINTGFCFGYKNQNPSAKFYTTQSAKLAGEIDIDQKQVDFLNKKVSNVQTGKYNNEEVIAYFDKNDNLICIDNCNHKECYRVEECFRSVINNNKSINCKNFIGTSKKCEVNNIKIGDGAKRNFKSKLKCLNEKVDYNKFLEENIKKDKKIIYKQSGVIEAGMLGNIIGHLYVNREIFINSDLKTKIKILECSSIPFCTLLAENIITIKVSEKFKNFPIHSIFRKGFFIFSIFEISKYVLPDILSESMTKEEKIKSVGKKILGCVIDSLSGFISTKLGMELGLALGFVTGPGAIFIGLLGGCLGGILGGYVCKKLNEKKEFIFYSDSLYANYIPKKFRIYCIPILKWKNVNPNAKSLAIELIVNEDGENPYWLVINIPAKLREYGEEAKKGETICNYKGIPNNSFSSCFILYVFDKKKIDIKEFNDMKNGGAEGEKLRKHLINFKILACN